MIPTIDIKETGHKINVLRVINGLSVRDIQDYLGFSTPQAIYKWQRGECLPTLDNLVALAKLFKVKMDDIIVLKENKK